MQLVMNVSGIRKPTSLAILSFIDWRGFDRRYQMFRLIAYRFCMAGLHRIGKYCRSYSFVIGITALVITISPLQAGQHRHYKAHEHGVALLNIAVEGYNLYIEFSSPSANIVGFEHHPRTLEQKDAVAGAVRTLQQGDAP